MQRASSLHTNPLTVSIMTPIMTLSIDGGVHVDSDINHLHQRRNNALYSMDQTTVRLLEL